MANEDRSSRHYFCPRHEDRKHGWATIRLLDAATVRFDCRVSAVPEVRQTPAVRPRYRQASVRQVHWQVDEPVRPWGRPSDET